ncbi:hypothetical protein SSPO_035860 [Streptomyces antimycoticus]|uniref:Uncharacterized protein n=1 Tax=Streptomyces antimycoticus TaxID=68175 RepID=A0A499UM66_9ACTN|nr:hypothetical protein SSPO_035860 [Streptomyces antimycoticus]
MAADTTPPASGRTEPDGTKPKKERIHYLYLAVIGAVALGILVGFAAPDTAVELKPIGEGFVNLIKMLISPIIFCTIVLGSARCARPRRSARSAVSRSATSW